MAVLQEEGFGLIAVAELLRVRPYLGHLVGRDPWPDHIDRRADPFRRGFVSVNLMFVRLAAYKSAVVAGPVAIERVHDVEKDHVARLNHAVGERMRMRPAALPRYRVDALYALRSH